MVCAVRARVRVILASFLLAALGFAVPGYAQGPATLSRTPWQMYRNPIVAPVPDYGSHGNINEYLHAPPIPPVNAATPLDGFGNGGWVPAPNGATIGFGSGGASRLGGYACRQALDFTFFQTLVDVPFGTTITQFSISFSGMDDGSRVTIFNSANPGGLVIPGSYVALGNSGTTNLNSYIVAGETNRVVITQVDDCWSGNNLQVANVVLNGSVVQTATSVPPTFSVPFEAPSGACICTPLLMNTDLNGTQNWYVKAQGGPLTITAFAHAVNGFDPEKVVAKVYTWPANVLVDTLTAEYPAGTPGGTAVGDSTAPMLVAAGALFRVEVSTPPPTVGTQPHFRLSATNAESIATGSPSAPSFEHEEVTWHFNVAAGEDLKVSVLLASPPDPAVTVNYDLFDPTGAFHSSGSVNAPGAVFVPAAAAGTWALHVHPSAHYRLEKVGGADRGIYLAWDSSGSGTVQATILDGNAGGNTPFTAGPVNVALFDADNNLIAQQLAASGSVVFPMKLPVGEYTVRITAPLGFTAVESELTLIVTCDEAAEATFVVADVTPPEIQQVPDLVIEATAPGGMPAFWVASGSDLGRGTVPVTCTPAAGSTFTLGTATVVCNAVDLAGNDAAPMTFTVTVQDTVAPAGACTPSYNPSTKNVPRASRRNEDGFYLVSGSDAAGAVTLSIGSYTLQNGETVKFTQSPGLDGVVLVNSQGREPIRHFRVGPGDPVITITDGSGNTSTQTCYVPPIPK